MKILSVKIVGKVKDIGNGMCVENDRHKHFSLRISDTFFLIKYLET